MCHGFDKVLIVGAGPAGLLLALLLAQRGIHVDVLESQNQLDQRPRGAAYGPAAARVLRRAGIIDKVREKGVNVRSMCWRKLSGEYITGMSGMDETDYPDRYVCYPVHLLASLIMEELLKLPSASVHWCHKVVGVGQNDEKAWANVETSMEVKTMSADFVVGCDGARSGVRKALFGRNFPGRNWDKQIVATNVYYDFDKYGWSDVQWIVHPEHWFIVARIGKDGLWRVAYGERSDLSPEELKARLPWKFQTILPGHPTSDQYKIVNFSPFQMQQRCVERMRVGRVLLAGDAAHLCNPMGGLGLTGGIADVGSLIDCLYGIHDGDADLEILDKYDEIRREIYHKVVDHLSSTNLERMIQDGDTIFENDPILKMIAEVSKDPKASEKLQQQEEVLVGDMTQFYNTIQA